MFRMTSLSGAAILATVISAQAATVTLFDDNFNADSAGVVGFQTVTNLTKWNVTQGNVDILGAGFGCTGCIDLDGSFSQAPAVLETKQILNFVGGVMYTFQLFFSGGTQQETVTFAVQSAVSFLAGSGPSIFSISDGPGSDTSSTLSIHMSAMPDNFGPYLDRVLVTYDNGAATVPLPAGAPLLLAGLGALGLAGRRRRT